MIIFPCIWHSCIYFHSKHSSRRHNQECRRSIGHSFGCRTFILVRGCIPIRYTVLHFDLIIHTDATDRRLARSLSLDRISHVDCMTFTSHTVERCMGICLPSPTNGYGRSTTIPFVYQAKPPLPGCTRGSYPNPSCLDLFTTHQSTA